MNKKIYIGAIIISLFLLVPACIWDCKILTIASGIGCSGIAAAIMAIFLESATLKKEKERKAKARAIYLMEIKDQLKMMFERILWFDQRLDDDFDWNLDPTIYSSFKYMIYVNQYYPNKEKISFEEAEKRLEVLKEKYSLEQQSKMPEAQLQKVQKMFLILYVSGQRLLSEVNSIKERRIELDTEEYLSLEEIETVCSNISLGVSLMCMRDKDYGAAIYMLLLAYKIICKKGNYTDEIDVGLHGTIKMSEI